MYAIAALFFKMTLELKAAAQTYPLFIIGLLVFLTTLYVLQMIRGARKNGITSGLEDFEGFLPKQFIPIVAMIVLYLIVMYAVGFWISTLLFMMFCLCFLKVKLWQSVLSTAAILALVYCAFTLFLHVKLPSGILL